MIYQSRIIGEITFKYVNNSVSGIIDSFINNHEKLNNHITKKIGHTANFSLPESQVSNINILFNDNPGEYFHVKESLQLVISFLKTINVTGINIDIIHHGYNYDDIVHYAYKDDMIVHCRPRLVYDNYTH